MQELHYITPLVNLASILQHGIVSHNRAAALSHTSIANESVQGRRADKQVPGGMQLHDYVNLYFDARNSMMYDRKGMRANMVVLRVAHSVLEIPGVVIADGNAASSGTKFGASPTGLASLDPERVYAHSWTTPTPGSNVNANANAAPRYSCRTESAQNTSSAATYTPPTALGSAIRSAQNWQWR